MCKTCVDLFWNGCNRSSSVYIGDFTDANTAVPIHVLVRSPHHTAVAVAGTGIEMLPTGLGGGLIVPSLSGNLAWDMFYRKYIGILCVMPVFILRSRIKLF